MKSSPPASTGTPISERFARIALAVERYVLPWIFLWLAWSQIDAVHAQYAQYHRMVGRGHSALSWPLFWAGMTRNVLLSCLLAFFGLTLLISRRPAHLPKNLAHIVVPLAMSYYFFLYRAVDYLPPDLRESLLPVDWQVPASAVAVLLAIVGYAVALWGLFYLRRSFALLVAVREVVSGGPYVYVRHPMYLGYMFELAGLVLSSFSVGMVLLAAGFLALTVARARLEEARLAEACPAYLDYTRRTGFLFPRFRRPIGTPATSGSRIQAGP